jgi:uncharacterized protein YndB with AHSA1/START domain
VSGRGGWKPDPRLDLVLERVVDVPPDRVWAAWTEPKRLVKWFTPAPWTTTECEIDLRPGGIFRTVMRSPEGESFPNVGCYLEVVPRERLVWTDVLLAGFRPAPVSGGDGHCVVGFTAAILLAPEGKGTRYTAVVLHRDPEGRRRHEEMGFHEGWGKALDQLVEEARRG